MTNTFKIKKINTGKLTFENDETIELDSFIIGYNETIKTLDRSLMIASMQNGYVSFCSGSKITIDDFIKIYNKDLIFGGSKK